MKALSVCSKPGCHELVPAGYCSAHTPPAWTGSQRPGSTRRWRELRGRILKRDPICRGCGAKPATEVDHIVPLAMGGTDHPTNLQGLCRGCHGTKSGREGSRARR